MTSTCTVAQPTRADAARPKVTASGPAGEVAVSSPSDPLEREADRVADRVMRMTGGGTAPRPSSCGDDAMVSRSTGAVLSPGAPAAGLVARSDVEPSGAGRLLDPGVRSWAESAFGADFSSVRVHTGPSAEASAASIKALAYTTGSDIVFGRGQYQPGSSSGRRLLAHELAHTLQVGGGPAQTVHRACSDPEFCTPYATEEEAESAEWWIRNTYLRAEGVETFGTEVKSLYEAFLDRRPGDSLVPRVFEGDDSYLVSAFKSSWDTKDDMDAVIELIGGRLDRISLTPGRRRLVSIEQFLTQDELDTRPINYSNPLSVAGHIAGGIGESDAGPDYRKISFANVGLERVELFGGTGYVKVQLYPKYEVFDTIDFCPGDCGSPAEQLITIPMSRLEKSGHAYDVPFKVIFWPESRSARFWF